MASKATRRYETEEVQKPVLVRTSPDTKNLFYKNVGLFADTFLENHLTISNQSYVQRNWETDDLPEFYALYEWMLSTWNDLRDVLPTLSEAQLEQEWIRPILERLGWKYDVQATFKKYGKKQIPDYALFASKEDWKKARGAKTDDAYFRNTIAVADAKAMGIDLDGSAENNSNPGFQIIQYLTHTEKSWGILTDGLYWRLYSTRAKSKYLTYYEVNVEKFLAKGVPDREQFKWFYNFFRKDAFVASSESTRSFLDFVFDEGAQYAQEVEIELKSRAFELVEKLCLGFAGGNKNLPPEKLTEIYNHSLFLLFRMMFILNAEAKGLLNVSRQADYFRYSIRGLCLRLKDEFEENAKWAASPQSYNYLINLFDMLAKGDENLGIHRYGNEVFESGDRRFFKDNSISDSYLNEVLVRLACSYDKKKKSWQFIDYHRLSADHLGSLFEGLLEFHLVYDAKAGKLRLEHSSGERKATGSFYTPDYIVDNIIESTVGPIVSTDSVAQILSRKIVDPAMGSGHFLLGVVRYLHGVVLEKLNNGDKSVPNLKPADVPWAILHSCIHGVDINPLAVELAKFSLWIYTARTGYELEPLADQLMCGNSLIDVDFKKKMRVSAEESDSLEKVRPFSWESRYESIYAKRGGFDAVVGNPPYSLGRDWSGDLEQKIKDYLKSEYSLASYQMDLYILFLEKFHRLAGNDGRVGLIIPNTWMNNTHSGVVRTFVLKNSSDLILTQTEKNVFEGATVDTIVVSFRRSKKHDDKFVVNKLLDFKLCDHTDLKKTEYLDGTTPIGTSGSAKDRVLLTKLHDFKMRLSDYVDINRGIHPYRTGGFGETAFGKGPQTQRDVDERPYHSTSAKKGYRKFVYGKDLKLFSKLNTSEFVSYGDWLAEPRSPKFFEGDRIYSRKILADRLVVTFESSDTVADQQVYISKPKSSKVNAKLLCGILGSSLISYYIRNYYNENDDTFPQIKVQQLKELPIPNLDEADASTVRTITNLIESLLAGKKSFDVALANELDRAVYTLFKLTKAEIVAVEAFKEKMSAPKTTKRVKTAA